MAADEQVFDMLIVGRRQVGIVASLLVVMIGADLIPGAGSGSMPGLCCDRIGLFFPSPACLLRRAKVIADHISWLEAEIQLIFKIASEFYLLRSLRAMRPAIGSSTIGQHIQDLYGLSLV